MQSTSCRQQRSAEADIVGAHIVGVLATLLCHRHPLTDDELPCHHLQAGNTMGCGYKGVVELVAEGCSSWTANIKVNGLPQPQQPVGSSSLQAVAAWMHDEGLRMLFELKGVRCRNDLLNLDADMLETVGTLTGSVQVCCAVDGGCQRDSIDSTYEVHMRH